MRHAIRIMQYALGINVNVKSLIELNNKIVFVGSATMHLRNAKNPKIIGIEF